MSQYGFLATESALGRDEKKFRLEQLIKNKKVSTIYDASKIIGVTPSTIKSYLSDLNLMETMESFEKEVLELAILNKKVRTVQSGAECLRTTKRTILKYALDLDMALIDTDKNKLTEGSRVYCLN